MKILLVLGTAVVALLWTVFIAVSAALADWLAGQGGQLQGGMQALTQWPMPAWIGLWLDPALAETLRASVVWSVEALAAFMPWIVPLLEWVAPLLWVIWAIAMAVLVALAGVGLFVIGRLRGRATAMA
ncbi:hypothetical protein [Rhodoferax sp.]|uniref:hypothetical protein n=1 Tax=Rhodoferax sp. TaxID=50421 RepID=UPI0025DA7114|nr:hypothetical protein [Rhodoferax sp.]